MEFKPLPEQAEIIDSQNKNLLVSASAGSGKTTVMIARICKLIESGLATPKNLLVMTYTTSAASEMKQKLYNTLKQKISDPEILDEIATSDISTIHSFCSRLLKKYFYPKNKEKQGGLVMPPIYIYRIICYNISYLNQRD